MIDEDFFGGGGSADLQLNGAGTNGFGASTAAAAPQQFLGMAGIGAVAGAGSMPPSQTMDVMGGQLGGANPGGMMSRREPRLR